MKITLSMLVVYLLASAGLHSQANDPRTAPPRDPRGPAVEPRGAPPRDPRGPAVDPRGAPPRDPRGPAVDPRGAPPRDPRGAPPPRDTRGAPPRDPRGPAVDPRGAPPRDPRGAPPPRDPRGAPPRDDQPGVGQSGTISGFDVRNGTVSVNTPDGPMIFEVNEGTELTGFGRDWDGPILRRGQRELPQAVADNIMRQLRGQTVRLRVRGRAVDHIELPPARDPRGPAVDPRTAPPRDPRGAPPPRDPRGAPPRR